MKNTKINMLLAALLLISAVGCGKKQDPVSASVVEGDSAAVSEIVESTSSEEAVSVSETPEIEEEEKKDPRYEISIPEGQKLKGVYNTIEGLEPKPGTYVAVVAKDLASGYWKAVRAGAEQAINDLNQALGYTGNDRIRMTFEGPAEENGIDAQINTIDSVITDSPDALCLGIIDIQSCQAQIELAGENGIPVIITDSGIKNDAIVSRIAIDNREAGREAARRLAASMNDNGQVLVIAHQVNAQTSIDRVAGFTEEMMGKKGILLVETLYEDSNVPLKEQMTSVLERYPGISGIFCTNENMSNELLKVLPSLTFVQPVSMIGFDSGKEQMEAIDAGIETGLISQNPYAEGYATIVAAIRAELELELDEYVDTGFVYLDAETIHLEENQKYIYQ